jgi:hypothetical protein
MSIDGDAPSPDPRGELVPAPRRPNLVRSKAPQVAPLLALFDQVVAMALDALDAAGDAVAERLGLRSPGGSPPSPPAA